MSKQVVSLDDVSELAELLIDIAGSWELFLGALGVFGDTRDQIRLKHPYSPKLCLLEGLERWVISNDSPTYESVIKALRGKFVTNKPLASAIEEFGRRKHGLIAPSCEVQSDESVSQPQRVTSTGRTEKTAVEQCAKPKCDSLYDKTQAMQKSKALQKSFILQTRQLKRHLKDTFTDHLLPEFLDGFILELPLSIRDEHEKFFDRKNSEINRTTTFDELFTCLSTYWDYLNYSLLQGIMYVHGTEEMQQEMECYVRDVEEFCRKTTLKVFWELEPLKIRTKPPSGFSQFVTKHSITRVSTLEDLENIRLEITKEFHLHMCALLLIHVVEGSVVITWFVPSSVVSLLKLGLTGLELLTRLHIEDVTFFDTDVESPDAPEDYLGRFLEAAESGDTDRVQALLSTGVDVNTVNEDSLTALSIAALSGSTSTVSALLEAGADVNVGDKFGWNALMCAAFNGHTSTVSALLEAGADVNIQNHDGRSALILAAVEGHTSTVTALLKGGADVNVGDKDNLTALSIAALSGSTSTVSALLEAGADVNVGDKFGWNALMCAAFKGHTSTVSALLEAGADVNVGDKEGSTALMLAACWGHTASLQALVDAGADLNIQDCHGTTALIIALQNGCLDIAETLIRAGEDPNKQRDNATGWNALFFAAKLGSVRLLLERGADPTVKDKKGVTAYHVAQVYDHYHVMDELEQHSLVTAETTLDVAQPTVESDPPLTIQPEQVSSTQSISLEAADTVQSSTIRERVLLATKLLRERFARYAQEVALPGRAEKKRSQAPVLDQEEDIVKSKQEKAAHT